MTAFLMRENGLWSGDGELNASNAAELRILRGIPTPHPTPEQVQVEERSGASPWLLLVVGLVILLPILFFVLKKIQNKTTI